MQKIVLNETLRAQLNDLTQEAVVCDESGKAVARVVPERLYQRLMAELEEPELSEAEWERRSNEKGYPLKELWKRLGVS